MSGKHSIVILYTGKDCPDDIITAIASILCNNGITSPELINIQYKDQDAIAALLLKAAVETGNVDEKKLDDAQEALKQAIIYIDGLYGDLLKGHQVSNLISFGMKLRKDAEEAALESSFNILNPSNNGRKLWKAIRIIATEDGIIPPSIAKKYHFNNTVVEIIKSIYNDLS